MRAFFRLLLRPIMLFMLFVLFWAVLGPGLVIGSAHADRALADLRSGTPSIALLHYALILGITLPAAVGFMAATASLELQYTRLSWMLPGLPRRLTTGIVALMLPAVVAVGWLTGRASTVELGVAGAAISTFWFAAMLHVPDAASEPRRRLLLMGAVIVSLVRPGWYIALVTSQPALVALIALAAAALLLERHVAPGVRRRRMDTPSAFRDMVDATAYYRRFESGTHRIWHTSMVGAPLVAWVRAAAYEHVGGVPWGWAFLISGNIAIGAIAYISSPSVVLITCFSLALSGIQLRAGILYPLSRRQRARLLFAGNLLDVVLLTTLAGATAGTLALLEVPHMRGPGSMPFELPIGMALAFAVGPIAQWARARGPVPPDAMMRMGRHVIHMVAAWIAALVAMVMLLSERPALDLRTRLAIVALLIVVSQAAHYVRLQRLYAAHDVA